MAHDIGIHIRATEDVNGAFGRVGQYLKELRREARESGEMVLERSLASPEGLQRTLFQSLGQGLNAAVANAISEGLARATDKAVELRNELREGKVNAADMANEFAKELPLLGGFVRTFENVRELLTGEKEEIQKINEEAKRTTEYYNYMAKHAAEVLQQEKEHLRTLREINQEIELQAMRGSTMGDRQAQLAAARFASENKIDDSLRRQAEEEKKARENPERNKLISELIGQRDQNAGRIGFLQGRLADPNLWSPDRKLYQDELDKLLAARGAFQKQIENLEQQKNADLLKLQIDGQNERARLAIAGAIEQNNIVRQQTTKDLEERRQKSLDAAARQKELAEETIRALEEGRARSFQKAEEQEGADERLRDKAMETQRAQSALTIAQAKLRGDAIGAELEQLREALRERLMVVKDAQEREVLIRTEAIDEQLARQKTAGGRTPAANPAGFAAFTKYVSALEHGQNTPMAIPMGNDVAILHSLRMPGTRTPSSTDAASEIQKQTKLLERLVQLAEHGNVERGSARIFSDW